jgi:hypothetical protein
VIGSILNKFNSRGALEGYAHMEDIVWDALLEEIGMNTQ